MKNLSLDPDLGLALLLVISGLLIFIRAVTDNDGRKDKKTGRMIISGLLASLSILSYVDFLVKSGAPPVLKIKEKFSDIPDLSSITNGLYSSIGSYNDGGGKWIAIIHPTIITDIDSGNRVVRTVNSGELPILVRLKHNITSPRNDGTNKFIGLVEVGTNANGKFIRDYKPTFK